MAQIDAEGAEIGRLPERSMNFPSYQSPHMREVRDGGQKPHEYYIGTVYERALALKRARDQDSELEHEWGN